MNKYLKFEYWNTCDLGNIYYQGGQKFMFYLDADVGEPLHEDVEEGQENGDGDFIPTYRRQIKRYRIRTGLIPDFLIDAIQRMKLHDNIELTFKSGEVEQIYNVDVEPEWQFEKYAWQGTVTMTFDMNESITVGACCDNLTVEESIIPLNEPAYFLSPIGSDATGDGTLLHPWFTLEKAWAVVVAGDTIYMRGGTYEYTTRQDLIAKSGSAGNLIKIFNYPGETPVITDDITYDPDVQGQLIYVTADYIHIKGIEISYFEQRSGSRAWSALFCTPTNHSIFEMINYHHNGSAMVIEGDSTDNLVLNCDFHHNYDPYGRTPFDGSSYAYEDADGLNIREINYGNYNAVIGCRFYNNADDGFDCWGNDGYMFVDGCWAWSNGYREDGITTGGNGAGFKTGETSDYSAEYLRTVQNCLSFNNRQFGISQNGALCMHYIYNNAIYNNLYRGIYFSTTWGDIAHVVRNNIAYNNPTNFLGPPNTIVDHNSWQDGHVVSDADFLSVVSTGANGTRQADGSLPVLQFLHLASGSDLINAGTDVGLTTDCDGENWDNPAPSLGAFEY